MFLHRYGYIEKELNSENERDKVLSQLPFDQLILDIFNILRQHIEPEKCLEKFCEDNSTTCPNLSTFEAFSANYSMTNVANELSRLIGFDVKSRSRNSEESCLQKTKDYKALKHFSEYFPNGLTKADIKKPGSLLRWLFVQTADENEQRNLYLKYLG